MADAAMLTLKRKSEMMESKALFFIASLQKIYEKKSGK